MFAYLSSLIQDEFDRHRFLLDSAKCTDLEKDKFNAILYGNASDVDFTCALSLLSRMLMVHYGVKTIIISDEYYMPFQQGYISGFYDAVVNFMRVFFSEGFKDNPNLEFGFMSWILRVAKESVFSGMNNLVMNTVLDEAYSQYFGFTKDEVTDVLKAYDHLEALRDVEAGYDGYRFGNHQIFNPWSILMFLKNNGRTMPYWSFTGNNVLIGKLQTAIKR